MASNNMYRVGDFVYFETSAHTPYQIRKIEELNKTSTGAVEAKVICFYRRRDEQVYDLMFKTNDIYEENISEKDKHLLKHRELCISRQPETLPATHIRGKANVVYWDGNEDILDVLNKDNTFFYRYVYDASQKSIHTGNSCIRVGWQYQADVPETMSKYDKEDEVNRDTLKWMNDNNLENQSIDNFITVCCSVGTLARACDATSVAKHPKLLAAVAASSRDITINKAHDYLHESGYSIPHAVTLVTPNGNPVLIRDEMESWSASEAKLFEDGLNKLGKYFHQIHQQFLPWKKSPRQLVEFYYMWKTSEHYMQLKKNKISEATEQKLKQVYIPNYYKPNPSILYNESVAIGNTNGTNNNTSNSTSVTSNGTNNNMVNGGNGSVNGSSTPNGTIGTGCECCGYLTSGKWYIWGTRELPCKLCENCWSYWKRYGGLKNPDTQDKQSKDGYINTNSSNCTVNSTSSNNNSNSSSGGNVIGVGGGIGSIYRPMNNGVVGINISGGATAGGGGGGVFMNKSITAYLYQCPAVGCDDQFRQVASCQTHIEHSHPELAESFVGQWSLLEEYKNQKSSFIMRTSPEMKLARRLHQSQIRANRRLARCFNRDKRRQLANKTISRGQLRNWFHKYIDGMTETEVQELFNRQYKSRDFSSLNNAIERLRKLKNMPQIINGSKILASTNHQTTSLSNNIHKSHDTTIAASPPSFPSTTSPS